MSQTSAPEVSLLLAVPRVGNWSVQILATVDRSQRGWCRVRQNVRFMEVQGVCVPGQRSATEKPLERHGHSRGPASLVPRGPHGSSVHATSVLAGRGHSARCSRPVLAPVGAGGQGLRRDFSAVSPSSVDSACLAPVGASTCSLLAISGRS